MNPIQPTMKAGLLLAATFLLGLALGVVLQGGVAHRRERALAQVRGPGGFVVEMERIIRPRNAAQGAAISPLLVRTDELNRRIVGAARNAMRMALDSMRVALVPLIDKDQAERLDAFAQRQAGERTSPRNGPPARDGRPPHDGLGPPPRGGPPPPD